MNSLEIIVEGYAKVTKTGWEASSSTCLITTQSGVKIITDPGCNKELLLQKLSKKDIKPEDIDYVFITHHHVDHAMNIALFPNAKVVDEEAIYTQDKAVEGVSGIPDTDITIIQTPGHEYAHAAMIVPTKEGTIVVAGDNFWWEEGEEQKIILDKKDTFAGNMEELIESRKKVLAVADWIIPGHGKKQRVNKQELL